MKSSRDLIRLVGRPIRRYLRWIGYDIVSYQPNNDLDQRMFWIKKLNVDVVVDVGANEGQFVSWMRQRGYKGNIVSFEPQTSAFQRCASLFRNDSNWIGKNLALGETTGDVEINVAGNSVSSSLLPMLDTHEDALPESAISGSETVNMARLDTELQNVHPNAKAIYLKIDTQGFELPVLRGMKNLMKDVVFIELELSLVPLYEGQELMPKVWREVEAMGFTPIGVENGFSDMKKARTLQIDGLFVRTRQLNGD